MNHQKALRFLKYPWLLILAVMPIVMSYLPSRATPWLSVILAPSYLLWVVKLAYDNIDVVYFGLTRLWLHIANSQVRWNLAVEYPASLTSSESLEAAFLTVREAWPAASVWQDEKHEKQINLPGGGGVLRIRLVVVPSGPETEASCIHVDMSDLLVPFRDSSRTLEQIISVFESLRQKLQPKTEKYTLKVRFDGRNPYYGLFVRKIRIPNQEVISFQCDIDQHIGPNKGRIAVSRDRLAVITPNLTMMHALSKKYITLASLDLTSP